MRRMYSENQLLKSIEKESQENGLKVFENIVDKDGHARFIEGNVNITETTGVTKSYGKWSLSGSHLLIVLAISCANTSTIAGGLGGLTLPEWIFDKIYPTYSNVVARNSIYLYGADSSQQNTTVALQKGSDNNLSLYFSSLTMTKDRDGRIQFDLLIDNE